MTCTHDVKHCHSDSAKTKIASRKTSKNQRTVPKVVKHDAIQCKNNEEEVKSTHPKSNRPVEIPAYTRYGYEKTPKKVKNGKSQVILAE